MEACVLCLKQAYRSQFVTVKERIDGSRTIADVIRENIECYFVSLKT